MATYLGFDPKETSPFYFVSYDTGDRETVAQYVCEMDRRGLPLWYDHGIHTGTHWEQVIADHIIRCEAVILFFSSNIFKKEDSYVRREFLLAKDWGKPIFVVLLDRFKDQDVPSKYALWWGSVKDLQCVFTGDFSTIGDCAAKVMEDLAVPAAEGAPAPSHAPIPVVNPAPAPIDEGPMTMLRRRILESIPPDKYVTISLLEEKVGYPLSQPEARMLIRDMIDKKELENHSHIYWLPSFDLRGFVMDSIEGKINRDMQYVTEERLKSMDAHAKLFADELPVMLRTLVAEKRITKNEKGYCPAGYSDLLVAAENAAIQYVQDAGGTMTCVDYNRFSFKGLLRGDSVEILEALVRKGKVIRGTEICRLPSADVTGIVRERILRQIESTEGFVASSAFDVIAALRLPETELVYQLDVLCAEGKIAFLPSLGYTSPSFCTAWINACEDTARYILENPPRLYPIKEMVEQIELPFEQAKKVLAFLAAQDRIELKGDCLYIFGMYDEALLQHLAQRVETNGKLQKDDVVGILERHGLHYHRADEKASDLLQLVAEKCGFYLVKENKTCYTKAAYYELLCGRMTRAKSSATFRNLQKQFESLGDYEQSAENAAECGKKAEEADSKELAENKTSQQTAGTAKISKWEKQRIRYFQRQHRKEQLRKLPFLLPLILWFVVKFLVPRILFSLILQGNVSYWVVRLQNIASILLLIWTIVSLIRFFAKKKR